MLKPTAINARSLACKNLACKSLFFCREHPLWASLSICILLCLVSITVLDIPLARWAYGGIDPHWKGFFEIVTQVGDALWWYLLAMGGWILCAVAAGFALTTDAYEKWRKHAHSWLFMLTNMITAGILLHLAKFIFGRYRPKYLIFEDTYGFAPFSGMNSFPSGHTQAIVSAMIALTFMLPRHWATFYGIALLVAFSRVAVGAHFLADIIMGAWLAVAVAVMMKPKFEKKGVMVELGKH